MEPGWYPTAEGLRWWDGQAWGPLAPAPQSPAAPPPALTPPPAQPQPIAAPAPPPSKKKESDKSSVAGGCVVLVILLVGVGWVISRCSPAHVFPSSITSADPLNPDTVQVIISVHNDTGEPATPNCSLILQSPGGTYRGLDVLTPKNPIPAGGWTPLVANIPISGTAGARYVTVADSTVECKS